MATATPPSQPSLPWRVGSSIVMGVTGTLSRLFLFGANTTETHGLDGFLRLLDKRHDVENRERGLITGEPNESLKHKQDGKLIQWENSVQSHQCVRTYHGSIKYPDACMPC